MPTTLTVLQIATFAALAAAILCLWIRMPLSVAFALMAIALGYAAGVLSGVAIVWIALLALACWQFGHSVGKRRVLAAIVIAIVSLGLGLHVLPGYHNPQVVHKVVLSAHAEPYDLYFNFDKTMAGLLFLGLAYRGLIRRVSDFVVAIKVAIPLILANIVILTAGSFLLGYLTVDPHWTPLFLAWAFSNLLLTCLSEEAFFRAFIQKGIEDALVNSNRAGVIAVAGSSVLFGAAHFAGGWQYVLLAMVAGLGYGYVFLRTRRIEMSIVAHFCMNAVHFIFFTYPRLA